MKGRTFRFGDLRMGVITDDPGDLAWLQEFLCPSFVTGPKEDVDCTVRAIVDPARHQEIHGRRAGVRSRKVECFALDTRMISLPSWELDRGALTILDDVFDVFYVVRARGAHVEIVGKAPDLWRGRIPLFRVVRELATNHAIAGGAVLVHGAALRLGGRGVVVAGPKRAGKTTILTYLLDDRGARYVSNDRVLVRPDDRGGTFRGVPTIVTLRAAMVRRFPRLRRRVSVSAYNPCLRLAEARARVLGPIARDDEGRFHLSPAQYVEVTGTHASGGGRLHAFVFPRLTHRRGQLEIRRLTTAAALPRLRASLFRAAASTKVSHVFAPHPSIPRRADALVRRLAATVPCFECRAGSQAWEDRRGVTHLRETCL